MEIAMSAQSIGITLSFDNSEIILPISDDGYSATVSFKRDNLYNLIIESMDGDATYADIINEYEECKRIIRIYNHIPVKDKLYDFEYVLDLGYEFNFKNIFDPENKDSYNSIVKEIKEDKEVFKKEFSKFFKELPDIIKESIKERESNNEFPLHKFLDTGYIFDVDKVIISEKMNIVINGDIYKNLKESVKQIIHKNSEKINELRNKEKINCDNIVDLINKINDHFFETLDFDKEDDIHKFIVFFNDIEKLFRVHF